MNPVLGIDFGTSNSAAAYVDPVAGLQVLHLDGKRAEMPTAVFFANDPPAVLFGSQAMQAYLAGSEGRLMRSLKSLLGSALMQEYTAVNGQSLRFFDIVVLFLKELKRRCEAQSGLVFTHAMLGRPVYFVDGNPERDALAQTTLGQAALEAGFTHIDYQLEPIAAALDFEQGLTQETTALVVDIGGGTSDFTVIRLHPERGGFKDRSQDVLSTTGVHIGGTDFDRLLNLHAVMPSLGYKHLGKNARPVPNSVFFDLSTWHLIHQSYTRKAMHFAKELWSDYADLALHTRLMCVLQEQYGHRILAEVETAKISCSNSNQGSPIALDFLDAQLRCEIHAQGMAQALEQSIVQVLQCAQDCVLQSGLPSVQVVYLTGGSSAMRPLKLALGQAMPHATLVEGNRFGAVAAGLAYAGARKSA